MQDCARVSIITPLLLRTWLESKWVKPLILKAAETTISPSSGLNATDSITQCFAHVAKSNTVILYHSMSDTHRENMAILLRESRKSFQRLFQCAALAASSDFKRGGQAQLLEDVLLTDDCEKRSDAKISSNNNMAVSQKITKRKGDLTLLLCCSVVSLKTTLGMLHTQESFQLKPEHLEGSSQLIHISTIQEKSKNDAEIAFRVASNDERVVSWMPSVSTETCIGHY